MKRTIIALVFSTLVATQLRAAPLTFDFKDPKGINNVVFSLDAPLEAINGSANGISGTVVFDPEKPESTKGKITVATATLHVPNPVMKEHMLGGQWLDSSKNPEITFESKGLKNLKVDGGNILADLSGTLTLKGTSKQITIPVKMTYLKGKLADRTNGQMKGDLLVIRSNFDIKRSDYQINPGAPQDKVSDTINLTLSIAGSAPVQ